MKPFIDLFTRSLFVLSKRASYSFTSICLASLCSGLLDLVPLFTVSIVLLPNSLPFSFSLTKIHLLGLAFILLLSTLARTALRFWLFNRSSFFTSSIQFSLLWVANLKILYNRRCDTDDPITDILSRSKYVQSNLINPLIELSSSLFSIVTIFTFLFYQIKSLLIPLLVVIALFYILIVLILRPSIQKCSSLINTAYVPLKSQILDVTDRELILQSTSYLDQVLSGYKENLFRLNNAESSVWSLTVTPKYVLEGILLTVIILFLAIQDLNGSRLSTLLSQLALLAIGLQRLIPAFQQIFGSLQRIRSSKEAVKSLLNSLTLNFSTIQDPNSQLTTRYVGENLSIDYDYQGKRYQDLLRPGTVYLLEGPSGCGKSTFLKALHYKISIKDHLSPPSINDLIFQRLSTEHQTNSTKNTLTLPPFRSTYLPQKPQFFSGSIIDNLFLGLPVDTALLVESLKASNCNFLTPDTLQSQTFPDSLSVGQLQRLALARTFITSTKVLLLDEPTAPLDQANKNHVFSTIIKHTQDHGLITIMVTHDSYDLKSSFVSRLPFFSTHAY